MEHAGHKVEEGSEVCKGHIVDTDTVDVIVAVDLEHGHAVAAGVGK